MMLCRLILAFNICCFFPIWIGSTVRADAWVGAYVWGGGVGQSMGVQRFYDTIQTVLNAGFDTVRFSPGPDALDGVDFSNICSGRRDRLSCYASVLLSSTIWDDRRLKRIMLTAIDRSCVMASSSNEGCLNFNALQSQKLVIKSEYMELFAVLYDRFKGSGVQIIISNWEGDNFIYCGSAYNFGRNSAGTFSLSCQGQWSSGQSNLDRIRAHLLWHRYRDEAVAEFISLNPGFDLIHAPEVNSLVLLESGCAGLCNPSTDNVADQIFALGGRSFCSYSSYDTQDLPADIYLEAIKKLLKICRNVIIGEAGIDVNVDGGDLRAFKLFRTLDEVRLLPGVVGVIIWNAVDSSKETRRFGLFDRNGREQVMKYIGPLRPVAK